jgi:hypothetical protein
MSLAVRINTRRSAAMLMQFERNIGVAANFGCREKNMLD